EELGAPRAIEIGRLGRGETGLPDPRFEEVELVPYGRVHRLGARDRLELAPPLLERAQTLRDAAGPREAEPEVPPGHRQVAAGLGRPAGAWGARGTRPAARGGAPGPRGPASAGRPAASRRPACWPSPVPASASAAELCSSPRHSARKVFTPARESSQASSSQP